MTPRRNSNRETTIVLGFRLIVVMACAPLACSLILDPLTTPSDGGGDGDGDGDGDVDTDGDGDADGDGDGDGDVDADGDGDGDGDVDADSDLVEEDATDTGCSRDSECDDDDPCTHDQCIDHRCDNSAPTDFDVELRGSDEIVIDLGTRGLDPSDFACTSDAVVLEHLNEDFESDWGVFEQSGSIELRDVAGAEGSTQGVRLCSDDSELTAHVPLDDAGEGRVVVSFWMQNANMSSDKYLLAEYSLNDSTYRTFNFSGDDYNRDEWRRFQTILPPETGPNGEVWLRFRREDGSGGGDCGDVDNVIVQSWLYASPDSSLLDEDFDDDYGDFVQIQGDDVTRVSSDRDLSVELTENRDGAIEASFMAPAPSTSSRFVIRWAWAELAGDGLNIDDYILAEYSDDGSLWNQMGVIGFDYASDEFIEFGVVPPDDVLDGELWIRFIAPSSANTSSTEGALIDDVVVSVDELAGLDDTFETFVDNNDGSYSSEFAGDLDGRRRITCRYQCGDNDAIINSVEATL